LAQGAVGVAEGIRLLYEQGFREGFDAQPVSVVNVLNDPGKPTLAAMALKPEQFVVPRFLDTLDKSGILQELCP